MQTRMRKIVLTRRDDSQPTSDFSGGGICGVRSGLNCKMPRGGGTSHPLKNSSFVDNSLEKVFVFLNHRFFNDFHGQRLSSTPSHGHVHSSISSCRVAQVDKEKYREQTRLSEGVRDVELVQGQYLSLSCELCRSPNS